VAGGMPSLHGGEAEHPFVTGNRIFLRYIEF